MSVKNGIKTKRTEQFLSIPNSAFNSQDIISVIKKLYIMIFDNKVNMVGILTRCYKIMYIVDNAESLTFIVSLYTLITTNILIKIIF